MPTADVSSTLFDLVGRTMSRVQEQRLLPADVLESDEEVLVIFDAPGAMSTDIQVNYEDGAILVRVDRFRDFYDEYEMVFPGRGLALDGRATLPDGVEVDPDAATAELRPDGCLYIYLPKISPGTEDD